MNDYVANYKGKWSNFLERYLDHPSAPVRWFACQCAAHVLQMNETQLELLAKSKVDEDVYEKLTCTDIFTSAEIEAVFSTKSQQIQHVVNVSGINIPTLSRDTFESSDLISCDTTSHNLKKLALGLTTGKALCLQGPVGSGKTCLVEYLAGKTGRKAGDNFIKVQLSDQTDSKMLLGTYRCTDIPGEFIWQPGVLTQAVIGGYWLLLEDIDLASMDIASVLSSVLENGTLSVPGYSNSLEIAPGFQLFLTQRLISTSTGYHRKHCNALKLLEKHTLQINIDPLTSSDLKHILVTRHPEFTNLADRMINVLYLFTKTTDATLPKTNRLISTRDFFKWLFRAAIDFNVKSQASTLKVFQDAIDVFCCSYHNQKEALMLATEISTLLGIVNHKADYFFKLYKPEMKLTSDRLTVGRASIERDNDLLISYEHNFYFTRLSAVLLERIMCCVTLSEPVLLVGETGTGKTSTVQYLANTIGQKLIVINMNQQSDSADLLGGFKPVDLKFVVGQIKGEFEQLFRSYFKVEPNKKYLGHITRCFNEQQWSNLLKLMRQSCDRALSLLRNPTKKIKTDDPNRSNEVLLKRWQAIDNKLRKFDLLLKQRTTLAFAFIEGSLVKAVEKGYWVLLDEINLANADTLECLSGLLESSKGSLSLLERGDKQPVKRHPNFALFACMNPSTDVGKKELPGGLRNRFTEFYVDELTNKTDLLLLVNKYLEAQSLKKIDENKIVDFYLKVRKSTDKTFCDGLGHKPHFSLRTLCRALKIASKNPCGTFKRSLFEAFSLSFLTQLDAPSYSLMEQLISSCLIGDAKALKSVLNQKIAPPKTSNADHYLQFEDYWVRKGNLECSVPDNYILTDSVRKNLKDLSRIVSIGRLPVLLQGDTSVGKTSLITYLAKSSGNKCVRINNHEHTDLQEYIGSYVSDSTGKLVFREGLLVEAMRQGHWIILDELNLAPTDVLEALNRVLDDNRELYIPETQETIKANPNFMLFATQNPPGSYGGRKTLSRAFRNRFVELHFNEIPRQELAFILHRRCEMSQTYAKKMIDVMVDLQTRRKGSSLFAGKQGFITLRDLFRWGERYRLAQNVTKLYDWDQHLADEGYLVLAGRVRKDEEKNEIALVLEKYLKRQVNPYNLFTLCEKTSLVTKPILQKIEDHRDKFKNIVWTYNMRQLAVMVIKAFQFKEPVLLVGETGGGKTTVCRIIAEQNEQQLVTVNCHMHTEGSDFIGGLRPVRNHTEDDPNKLFEWVNGPLIQAMSNGSVFLADEISLVDDSVLERLNSLLEPERTLLIAEKGSDINDPSNSETITAHPDFYFIGTMNPGSDFGKKELSPALRNRFTEIWCNPCTNRDDLIAIIERNLTSTSIKDNAHEVGINIVDFIEWFKKSDIGRRFTVSVRDILTWVGFMNNCADKLGLYDSYVHGANLTFLDGLGSGVSGTESWKSLQSFKHDCSKYLKQQIQHKAHLVEHDTLSVESNDQVFGIKPFYIEMGTDCDSEDPGFAFNAPTTMHNTLRLLRGMQLNKAILLEGSPGVGKTSLVAALAKVTRHKIFRVNLSDQTDVSDLFGADLPVEGGLGGQFSWRDGPLLRALKQGHWILLDELNLASQSVLEGLNACLDHRGEIFIPELGRTFHVKPGTRFFACQNPLKQGGSRRGLPQSFLNRFVQVYVTSLTSDDLQQILQQQFPDLPTALLSKMLSFNSRITEELDSHRFGHKGSPWEFNLRDITRWCEATIYHYNHSKQYQPENSVSLIYRERMRTRHDKAKIDEIFEDIFDQKIGGDSPILYINDSKVHIGDVALTRNIDDLRPVHKDVKGLVLRSQLAVLRSLSYCVNLNWMSLLVGESASGKSTVVKVLADLVGKELRTLPVTSSMDTTDILGGFEQTDYTRHLDDIVKDTERLLLKTAQVLVIKGRTGDASRLFAMWEDYSERKGTSSSGTMEQETKLFLKKLAALQAIWHEILALDNLADEKVKSLKSKAQTLADNVKNEGSLNAGGKFEWIDSVLIKCLQNGYWLLVDNVNLCSPAVLDRLNGLLEPRGVLTVGERGVDQNGRMIEIQPHPDFRLFLTMDPKNGEISRAMRNRGVEIYILSDKEVDRSDEYDLRSLISLQGLHEDYLNAALLVLHNSICDVILGERPNISELLRASTLISQQMRHDNDPYDVFTQTLVEVYYKTRHSTEFSCNDFFTFISNQVKSVIDNSRNVKDDSLYSNNVTLKVDSLQLNSALEKVTQQSSLLVLLLSRSDESCNIDHYVMWLFINFYTITTAKDLNLRRTYLNNVLININRKKLESLSNWLYKWAKRAHDFIRIKLQSFPNWPDEWAKTTRLSMEFPLDYRWIPQTFTAENTLLLTNTITLSLYLGANLEREKLEATNMANPATLLAYMQNRRRKAIENQFDDILVDQFLDLLDKYDEFLLASMSSIQITDQQMVEILQLLSWRFVFYRCAFLGIDKMNETRRYIIEMTLKVHYYWFSKYSVSKFVSLLHLKVPKKLKLAMAHINDNLKDQLSILYKLGKNYQKLIHKPSPSVSQEEIEWSMMLNDAINLYSTSNKRNDILNILSQFWSDKTTRSELVTLKAANCGPSTQKIEMLKTFTLKLFSNSAKQCKRSYRVHILAFDDYFTHCKVRQALGSGNGQQFKTNLAVPVDLVASLMIYDNSQDQKLKHNIARLFYQYLLAAPSKWNLFDASDELKVTDLSHYNPLLTYHLINVLVESGANFGNYRDTVRQHEHMNVTLWRNLPQLCHKNNDFLHQERLSVQEDFRVFMQQLGRALNIDNVHENLDKLSGLYPVRFLKRLTSCVQTIQLLDQPNNLDCTMLAVCVIHMQLGYLKALLNSQLPLIDPSEKTKLKKKYVEESITNFEQMKASFVHLNAVYSASDTTVHALHQPTVDMIATLKVKHDKLKNYVAVRPQNISYGNVMKVIGHGFATVLSPKLVDGMISDLTEQVNLATTPHFSVERYHQVIDKYSTAVPNYENLIAEWFKYSPFPDIIEPLLANITQFLYGLKSLLTLTKKACAQYQWSKRGTNLQETLLNLVRVPYLNENCTKYDDHIKFYTNVNMNSVLVAFMDDGKAQEQMLRLYKCGIQETFNCVVSSHLHRNAFSRFNKLLKIIVSAWNAQEEKREKIKADTDALYKTKTKCDDKTEEEQIQSEMNTLFPNFHVRDFSDIQTSSLLDDDPIIKAHEMESLDLIRPEDIKFVVDLHAALVKNFTQTEWLAATKNPNLSFDFVNPLVDKFKVFKEILDNKCYQLDYTVDRELLGSFTILLGFVKNYQQCDSIVQGVTAAKKHYDFYNDANVEEVKSSRHILDELRVRVDQLLEEWPDQPTLITIVTILERICNFDISSPLPRFLTGFEILLTKCNEWEQVAHSGVSLSEHSHNLIQQVITWRKMELSVWKNLMTSTFQRFNKPLYKWWIFFYNLMEQFFADASVTDVQLVESLQEFISQSNLGEFQSRVDLLLVFHCYAVHLKRSKRRDSFINILWNLHCYFKLFFPQVANKIKELRTPIEKKLKDYVKIVRWKDINYWTVKQTVDKSHKILHKFVREFQDVLRQPVLSCLTNDSSSVENDKNLGIYEKPQKPASPANQYAHDAATYMANESLKENITNLAGDPHSILNKIETYFTKSRKLCQNVIQDTKYPALIQSLDVFIGDVIETSTHLKGLEVDTSLAKEKRKSQAKNILQQKHRALSDLFKSLSKIGLSFRTGMVEANLKRPTDDYDLEPINLSACFNHIKLNQAHDKILALWSGCEKYYLKSLMRHDVLATALKSPAQDLGLPNVERCKGFASHLLTVVKSQKRDLIKSSRSLYYLRYYANKIGDICAGAKYISVHNLQQIQDTMESVVLTMNQFNVIVHTCPEQNLTDVEVVELEPAPSQFVRFKHDSVWIEAHNCIVRALAASNNVMTYIDRIRGDCPSHDFDLHQVKFVPLSDYNIDKELDDINASVQQLLDIFGQVSFGDSLKWLLGQINHSRALLNQNYSAGESDSIAQVQACLEKLCQKSLVVIQNLVKKYGQIDKKPSNPDDDDSALQDEHLKIAIMDNLAADITTLEIDAVSNLMHKLAKVVFSLDPAALTVHKTAILSCIPLLEQTMLLYQYFMAQQISAYRVTSKMTSIILNIFIDLVSKGFCIPPELSDDVDSDGVGKPSDGLGLGEGQGERDVSDKIESEDQLEDAQPADAEQNKDNSEKCPEEDKGIEMSEDFEGDLQDVKPKDDDEESGSDSEAEEQMGETDKGVDKLDEQIWGSDDEDDGGEGDDKNDDQGQTGERDGDEQIAAKDEKRTKDNEKPDDNSNKEKEQKEKDIDEMKEPEYDDDQVDPYHGNQPELPEPEPMDLPDDIQLDEGDDEKENGEEQGDNPFDIDAMKEQNPFEKPDEKQDDDHSQKENNDQDELSSEDEDIKTNDINEANENEEANQSEDDDSKDNTKREERMNENANNDDKSEENQQNDASALDQSKSQEDNLESMETDNAQANDKVDAQNQSQTVDPTESDLCQEDKPDQEGVGQSQMEQSSTGHTAQTRTPQQIQSNKRKFDDLKRQQKPGDSNSERSLGDMKGPVMKKLRTIDDNNDEGPDGGDEDNTDQAAEMYKHIKETEKHSTQVMDAATKEQAESQKDQGVIEDDVNEDVDNVMLPEEDDQEDVDMLDQNKKLPEAGDKIDKRDNKKGAATDATDILNEPEMLQVEGEIVPTLTVPRGLDTTFNTSYHNLANVATPQLSMEEIHTIRLDVQSQLSGWKEPPNETEADATWQKISSITLSLAQDLSEQLRLVLEPTQATRLKGDFRTGRRINMRKVIPYIASQFRKDKIWLRRTKPSKRNYQITIAIDDSSSMAQNHSKELAFESVALISKALTLLESGQLSVLSFGEATKILHKLQDPFTDRSGVRLLQMLNFDQQKTCVANLVDFATEMYNQAPNHASAPNAKLLIIVSDGMGVFSEGELYMREAVRRAVLADIFIVFVIVDSPENKHSILDIKKPIFKDGKLLGMSTYMEAFPFSFYIILRDINAFPTVLSDALRQWFEVVSNLDRR